MTVHLVSVGLSVLRALAEPTDDRLGLGQGLIDKILVAAPWALLKNAGVTDDLESDREQASQRIAEALGVADTPLRKTLTALTTAVKPHRWPEQMSAELETFKRVPGNGSTTVGRRDLAVLICSDTADGLLAGAWNAIALTGEADAAAALAKVTYVPDPEAVTAVGLRRGGVVVVRIKGMDAGEKGFSRAMRGLGVLANRLIAYGDLRKQEEFQFILSGGYKAAVPYMIGLAEAVRSVDDTCVRELRRPDPGPGSAPYPVKAWVQHETARDGTRPIELPLRRLVVESFRPELTDYDDNGIRTKHLGGRVLEGYAFEVRHRLTRTEYYELTPFGEALRELFSPGRGRVGD